MTYTTCRRGNAIRLACFSPYFFALRGTIIVYIFEWHTQHHHRGRDSCGYCFSPYSYVLRATISGLLFWMTYTTWTRWNATRIYCFSPYLLLFWMTYTTSPEWLCFFQEIVLVRICYFFEWHTQREIVQPFWVITCFSPYCLLFWMNMTEQIYFDFVREFCQ